MNNHSGQFDALNRRIYDRAFLRTVLVLEGVHGNPSTTELDHAMRTIERYGNEVTRARSMDLAVASDWLRETMSEQVAIQHAFTFVVYGSVMNPTPDQNSALREWIQDVAMTAAQGLRMQS